MEIKKFIYFWKALAEKTELKKQNKTETQENLRKFFLFKYLLYQLVGISVQFNHSVVSDSLRPHGLQYARLPDPLPTPGSCSNSCPSSR